MSIKHDVIFIRWNKESETIKLKIDEGKDKLNYYKKNGIQAQTKTVRREWLIEKTYIIEKKGYWCNLYVREDGHYKHYVWHTLDNRKNNENYNIYEGLESVKILQNKFNERTGLTFLGAFGYSDPELRGCIPRPLYYCNNNRSYLNFSSVNKVDYSSHYPANCCGKLPTIKNSIRVKGQQEPTIDFPFAFYIKSGHCAEYGRFDTRKWKSNYYLGYCLYLDRDGTPYYNDILPEEDETLLCKAAKLELTEEFEFFYNLKLNGDPQAKMVMNSAIGYFHPVSNRSSYRLFHIAAICLARANQKTLEITEKIGPTSVLQIINDCIIYHGHPRCGQVKKELGALIKEIDSARFRMRGQSQYIFMRNDKVILTKHSGFTANLQCKKLEDIDNWRN